MAGINPGVGGGSSTGTTVITDGVDTAIKATVLDLTNSNPLTVAITNASGTQITTFAGTEYADGAVRGTATGTLSMVDDGVNIQSMKGDSSGRPLVTIDTALPAGTAVIGKVSIDQTTPGTTNLVSAGQSGTWNIATVTAVTTVSTVTNLAQMNGAAITMGNGISGTGVQRVTIASDSTGSVAVTNAGTFAVQAVGTLTHNNAVPAAINVGALTALANAATPTFTETDQTLLSVDLSGRLRVQGTGATGSAVPGVAIYNAGLNGSGNLEGIRNIGPTLNTTTGIAAAGMVAVFDDTSPTSITENQYGSVRISANRNVYQTIRDAAGNERGVNVSAGNALLVDGSATTQPISGTIAAAGTIAHDAVGTSTNPLLAGGYASAAAPSDVSNDGDAVRAWHLRNGAAAAVLTAAGALIGGDAANGLDVDVTRVTGTVTTQLTTPVALTASTPGTVSVGTSSALAVASNGSRKGLTLVNLSNSYIYLGFSNTTAALNSGVVLSPNGGSYEMSIMTFTTGQVNAIADAASSTLAFQEYT